VSRINWALMVLAAMASSAGCRARQQQPSPLQTSGANEESSAYLADAREALDAVQAVQSLVRMGVSCSEYCRRIGDARIAVDRFLRNHPTDLAPPSRDLLEGAMSSYETAAQAWEVKIR
jgi:hypothetical protein